MGDGSTGADSADAARVTNARGASPYVIVCDHASNFIPESFGALGLPQADLTRHIAWDPGALPAARELARLLDAPLVESCRSRLLIDCNRPSDAPDLIPAVSETTEIPGNRGLSDAAIAERIALAYVPFHAALAGLVAERGENGGEVRLVSIHSFTPVYKGNARPWHVGVIHDEDERLSAPLLASLRREPGLVVGDNEPYSPADRVYHTLEKHGRAAGHACAMIEIRNDEIGSQQGQIAWARRLAELLGSIAIEEREAPRLRTATGRS